MAKTVRMTHPRSGQSIEVTDDLVPLHESQGWQRKPATKRKATSAEQSK